MASPPSSLDFQIPLLTWRKILIIFTNLGWFRQRNRNHWWTYFTSTSHLPWKAALSITSFIWKFYQGEWILREDTVSDTDSRTICILWYDLRVFSLIIECLKSAAKPIFFPYPNKYRSDLSKKLVFDPAGQRASTLETLKLWPVRELNPDRLKTIKSLT